MSGHSRQATAKHKKAVINAKRGKLFAKPIKNVEVAARLGGGNPNGNPMLHDVIQKAKKFSVPDGNIDRAVKRDSGAISGGADYETIMYEAYRPSGIAILIKCLTGNRNHSASDARVAVTRNGGTTVNIGSMQRLFARKGIVVVPKQQRSREVTEDDLLEATLEADLEEVNGEDEAWEAVYDPGDTVGVHKAIKTVGFDYDPSGVQFVVSFDQDVDTMELVQEIFRIIDALGDSDDV